MPECQCECDKCHRPESDTVSGCFLASCKTGELVRVAAAIALGVDVNVTKTEDTDTQEIGLTGLILSIYNNHPEVVDLLLEQRTISKNQRVMAAGAPYHGMSALQAACGRGGSPWAVARLGREEGLEVNSQGWNGWTPLTHAAHQGILPVRSSPLFFPQVTWTVSVSWSSCLHATSTL